MKYGKVLIFNLAIILIGTAIYFAISNRTNFFTAPSAPNVPAEQAALATQTATIGIVTYKVTPKNLSKSSPTWDFEVVLDTHTGSLDQDLVSGIRLSDDRNNEYQASNWEGDPPGGHHREGVLQFQALDSEIKSITLKINPGENMEGASLTWAIKE